MLPGLFLGSELLLELVDPSPEALHLELNVFGLIADELGDFAGEAVD